MWCNFAHRRIQVESLEQRTLLAGDMLSSILGSGALLNQTDTSHSGTVVSADAEAGTSGDISMDTSGRESDASADVDV